MADVISLESLPCQMGTATLDLRDGKLLTVYEFSHIIFLCCRRLNRYMQSTGDFTAKTSECFSFIYKILKVFIH